VALAIAVQGHGAPLDAVLDDPAPGAAVALLAAVTLGLLYAAYVELPRAMTEARRARELRRPSTS
jgi:hypothetical protein